MKYIYKTLLGVVTYIINATYTEHTHAVTLYAYDVPYNCTGPYSEHTSVNVNGVVCESPIGKFDSCDTITGKSVCSSGYFYNPTTETCSNICPNGGKYNGTPRGCTLATAYPVYNRMFPSAFCASHGPEGYLQNNYGGYYYCEIAATKTSAIMTDNGYGIGTDCTYNTYPYAKCDLITSCYTMSGYDSTGRYNFVDKNDSLTSCFYTY